MDTHAILGRFGFYRAAPQPQRERYAGAAEHVLLPEGAMFYREGDDAKGVAFVGAGNVRVFKTGESGREITLYHVRGGEACLVNMMCAFLRQPAIADACVEAPTEAVVLRPDAFRDAIRRDDAMREFVFEAIACRMVDVMTLIDEIAFRRVDARLEALLLQRFARQPILEVTHEWIAAELGTAREVVSRLLKELERRGAIELGRGHIALRDRARFAAPENGGDARESLHGD